MKKVKSLRVKIVILNFTVVFTALILAISFFFFSMRKILGSYISEDINFFLTETSKNIAAKTLYIEDVLLEIRRNKILSLFLYNEKHDTSSEELKKIANLYSDKNTDIVALPFVNAVYLINNNQNIISTYYYQHLKVEEMQMQSKISKMLDNFTLSKKDVLVFKDNDEIHLFFTVYTNFMQNIGTAVFSINANTVDALMRPTIRYENLFWFLYDKYDNILLGKNFYKLSQSEYNLILENSGNTTFSVNVIGNNFRAISEKLYMGLNIVIAVPENQFYSLIFDTLKIYVIYAIALTIFIILITIATVLRITRPLKEVVNKIKLVKDGNYDTKLEISDSTEFLQVSNVFNEMTERINYLINDVYEKKLLLQSSELKLLQSQINPHFMFNVLNMIAIKAQLDNNDDIYKMTSSFSHLIQAGIYRKDSEKITIKEELEYVEFYLYLQCYRYGEKLKYTIDVAEDFIYKCYVPKLCIQFIVENAVCHGIEPKTFNGNVNISIATENDDLKIIIKDDGVGFDTTDEIKLPLPQTEKTKSHNRVGLNNMHKLIQFFYGDKYGIFIKSEKDSGTTVTIFLPQEKNITEQIINKNRA